MYIFEFATKLWKKYFREAKELEEEKCKPEYDISEDVPEVIEDYTECEHIFMPIDSTGKMLACTKCGLLKKLEDIEDKNFFKNTPN